MSESLVVNAEQARQIFGSTELAVPEVFHAEAFMTPAGVSVQFGDTRLGLAVDPDTPGELYRVTGNTVPRLCGAMGSCAANQCGLAERNMRLWERQDVDCAMANSAEAFGGKQGFIITPTNNEAAFLWIANSYQNIEVRDENDEPRVLFGKVKPASIFVFSEDDVPSEGVFVGANNADNAFEVTTLELDGIRYVMVSSSSRLNLGDRETDAQLFRKALEGILERHALVGQRAQEALEHLEVRIDVGYSASLKNFKHDVRLPARDSEDANRLIAANGLGSYDDLTPTIVMSGKEGQYPGALEHGEVYGAFEAENDIDVPRSPAGCPGFGEYCYIHYPKITQRTIVSQLMAMGLQPENIAYDTSRVIDPAAVDNRLASNRRMQLAGIDKAKTLRSVNGATIIFPRLHPA